MHWTEAGDRVQFTITDTFIDAIDTYRSATLPDVIRGTADY